MVSADAIDAEYSETPTGAQLVPVQKAQEVPVLFGPAAPREKVAYATEAAKALRDIIDQRGLSVDMGGKGEHIELEAWQTCGYFVGVSAKCVATRELPDGGGWEATAVAIRTDTGLVIGQAESMCSKEEKTWSNCPSYALRGMAQTRAQSRALRSVLSWIAVLAGYNPTPAEEMPGYAAARSQRSGARSAAPKATTSSPAPQPATPRADESIASLQAEILELAEGKESLAWGRNHHASFLLRESGTGSLKAITDVATLQRLRSKLIAKLAEKKAAESEPKPRYAEDEIDYDEIPL